MSIEADGASRPWRSALDVRVMEFGPDRCGEDFSCRTGPEAVGKAPNDIFKGLLTQIIHEGFVIGCI